MIAPADPPDQAGAAAPAEFARVKESPIRQYVADGVYCREIRLAPGDIASCRPRDRSYMVALVRGRVTVAIDQIAGGHLGPTIVFVPKRRLAQFHAHDPDTVLLLILACPPETETDAGVFEDPEGVLIMRMKQPLATASETAP